MNEARGPESEPQPAPYVRLPWPALAAGLFVFVALLLAFGIYANQNLRPLGVVPAATVPPITAASTPTPIGSAVALSTAIPLLIAVPTTPAEVPVLPPSPTTNLVRPTPNPELAAQIAEAYEHYWQIRAEALFDLDTSRLNSVMTGDHLVAAEELIGQLRTENRAIQTDVAHKYVLLRISNSEADIADEYTDNSVYIDPKTHEILTQPTRVTVREQYRMTNSEGNWRVVSLVRGT